MSDNSVKTCHNCKYGTFDALWGIITCIRPAICKQRDLWEANGERNEEVDYISKKDAIEAITANSRDSDSKYLESERIILESDAIEALTILPSVKPERNLCRECKFVVYHGSVDKNGNVESCWYCRNWDGGTDEEGFCHEWERK